MVPDRDDIDHKGRGQPDVTGDAAGRSAHDAAAPVLARLAERWTVEGLEGPSEAVLLTPLGVDPGSPAHLRFVTMTRGISGLYPETELWERAGRMFADEATRWVFDTERVSYGDWRDVGAALAAHGLGRRRQDVRGWYDLARGIQGRFKGAVNEMIDAAGNTVSGLVTYVDQHAATFPLLAGDVTARRWADQLRRRAGVTLDEDIALTEVLDDRVLARLSEAGIDTGPVVAVHHALAAEVWAALPTARRRTLVDEVSTD